MNDWNITLYTLAFVAQMAGTALVVAGIALDFALETWLMGRLGWPWWPRLRNAARIGLMLGALAMIFSGWTAISIAADVQVRSLGGVVR